MSSETIMHYAMLIRLVSVMAIGGFGVLVAVLVPILRLYVNRLLKDEPHQTAGVVMRGLHPFGR